MNSFCHELVCLDYLCARCSPVSADEFNLTFCTLCKSQGNVQTIEGKEFIDKCLQLLILVPFWCWIVENHYGTHSRYISGMYIHFISFSKQHSFASVWFVVWAAHTSEIHGRELQNEFKDNSVNIFATWSESGWKFMSIYM
jgi:hypothetical protein